MLHLHAAENEFRLLQWNCHNSWQWLCQIFWPAIRVSKMSCTVKLLQQVQKFLQISVRHSLIHSGWHSFIHSHEQEGLWQSHWVMLAAPMFIGMSVAQRMIAQKVDLSNHKILFLKSFEDLYWHPAHLSIGVKIETFLAFWEQSQNNYFEYKNSTNEGNSQKPRI